MSKLYDALQHLQGKDDLDAFARPRAALRDPVAADLDILKLYQAVEARLKNRPSKVVQVLASGAGEGATTVAARLARLAAFSLGRSVLLLTVAKPSVSSLARLPGRATAGTGAALTLSLSADVALPPELIQPECQAGPRFITATLPENGGTHGQMLNPDLLTALWDRLRERAEWIVVDTPPAVTPPGLAIAPTVDGVVLVIEAEHTRHATAEAARDALTNAGANLLGVVLNKRRYYLPRFLAERL